MKAGNGKLKASTDTLLDGIFKASKFDRYVRSYESEMCLPSLSEHLATLCVEKDVRRASVIRKAGIDRSFGFQIFQGVKNPSRDKVIQLAFGFALDYEQTQQLLRIAHKSALYPRIKRDAALIYCLNRHMDLTDAQAMLSGMDLPILGREAE